jgi:hypothetical protein
VECVVDVVPKGTEKRFLRKILNADVFLEEGGKRGGGVKKRVREGMPKKYF